MISDLGHTTLEYPRNVAAGEGGWRVNVAKTQERTQATQAHELRAQLITQTSCLKGLYCEVPSHRGALRMRSQVSNVRDEGAVDLPSRPKLGRSDNDLASVSRCAMAPRPGPAK